MNLVKLIELMKFSLQSYINHESVAEVHIIIVYIDTLTNIKQLNHRKSLGEMSRFIAKPLYERLNHIYYMVIKIHSSLMFLIDLINRYTYMQVYLFCPRSFLLSLTSQGQCQWIYNAILLATRYYHTQFVMPLKTIDIILIIHLF